MALITSPANQAVKMIRSLRNRKDRQLSGTFFAEGLRIVIEALQLGAEIQLLVVAPELLTSPLGKEAVEKYRQNGRQILEVSADVFRLVASKEDPQGIGAVVAQQWLPLATVKVESDDCWVALDSVADPGNLGTILRTTDAVGGKGVILLDQCTDPYDPTAIRASMGAVFSQKLVKAQFREFAAWKKSCQACVVGTSGAAAKDYHQVSYPQALVLLMGSEREGLQENCLAICDQVVSIPMAGRSDSLNLAVATAIILYEIYNQHRDLPAVNKI